MHLWGRAFLEAREVPDWGTSAHPPARKRADGYEGSGRNLQAQWGPDGAPGPQRPNYIGWDPVGSRVPLSNSTVQQARHGNSTQPITGDGIA